ncbi:MAG: cupredoxin domain-containing protein [Solirubrobacteraceae bacterium]
MATRTTSRLPAALVATLLLALAVAAVGVGCGSDDSKNGSGSDDSAKKSSGGGSYGTSSKPAGGASGAGLSLAADPSGAIKFDEDKLSAKAGEQTLTFQNASSTAHALEIDGKGIEKETKTITKGSAKLTANLKPGTYEFYCPVADHKEEGMKGTLTVK